MKTHNSSLSESSDPKLAKRIRAVSAMAALFFPAIIAFGIGFAPPETSLDWIIRCAVAVWAYYPVHALYLTARMRFRAPAPVASLVAYGPFGAVVWLYVLQWLVKRDMLADATCVVLLILTIILALLRSRSRSSQALSNKAFFKCEEAATQTDPQQASALYEQALALLEQSIRMGPSNAAAFNEKGYVYSRLGKMRDAEEAHMRAVLLDSTFPKYRNNLFHVWIQRLTASPTQSAARVAGTETIAALDSMIRELPAYAAFHLNRALLIAMSGGNEREWEAELEIARRIYSSGDLPIEMVASERTMDDVISDNRMACRKTASWFAQLPA